MNKTPTAAFDTLGLSVSGIWVRRIKSSPSLVEEALSLAQVLQTWEMSRVMDVDSYRCAYAEVSGPHLQPVWVYVVEMIGTREDVDVLTSHPLAGVSAGQSARVVALVTQPESLLLGALTETGHSRRMIWLKMATPV